MRRIYVVTHTEATDQPETTSVAAFGSVSGALTVLGEDDRFHDRAVLMHSDTSHLSSREHRGG